MAGERRLSDALIGDRAYGKASTGPMINLVHGGNMGFIPDYSSFVSSNPYVQKNMVARLLHAPTGFDLVNDGQQYVDALKALVELLPRRIDGVSSGRSVEFVENAYGGAGEMIYEVSNVTRAQSNPSFTWDERYGKPIQAFLTFWIDVIMMDAESKYPQIISNSGRKPSDLLSDFKTMTVLFFEPDATHTKITDAWLCIGMMPENDGPREGVRDLTSGGSGLELSIPFKATQQVGLAVRAAAQVLLDEINRGGGANPNTRAAYADKIDADVKRGTGGYAEQISEIARDSIRV